MIIVIFGLPGTGKSYFGERLAEYLNMVYINSDRVRQELQLQGRYGAEEKRRVYEQMLSTTEKLAQQGDDVVLDATFSEHAYLQRAKSLAQQHDMTFKLIEMVADEEVIRERVNWSRKYSEADYEVYEKIKGNYEAIDEAHLVLDTSYASVDQLIPQALEYLYHD